MTRRLEQRLRAAGRDPEVHYFEGQDHLLNSSAENDMHEKLLASFARTLS